MSFSFPNTAASTAASSTAVTTTSGGLFGFSSKQAVATAATTIGAASVTTASGGFSFNLQSSSPFFATTAQSSKPASTTSSPFGGLFQSVASTPVTSVSSTTPKLNLPTNYTLGGSDGKSKEQRPMDVAVPEDTKNAVEAFKKFLEEQKKIRAECATVLMSNLENDSASLSRFNSSLLKSKENFSQLSRRCSDTKDSFYKILTASRVISKEMDFRRGAPSDYHNSLQSLLAHAIDENEKRVEHTCNSLARLEKHILFGADENALVQDIARAIRNVHSKLAYVSSLSTAKSN